MLINKAREKKERIGKKVMPPFPTNTYISYILFIFIKRPLRNSYDTIDLDTYL
jgi:hypothetical protein